MQIRAAELSEQTILDAKNEGSSIRFDDTGEVIADSSVRFRAPGAPAYEIPHPIDVIVATEVEREQITRRVKAVFCVPNSPFEVKVMSDKESVSDKSGLPKPGEMNSTNAGNSDIEILRKNES